ncbi:MAG TPA: sigma-70 family RNA polymerase sigma factor [Gemmataceae bacterium]|nr:sigma-70 family RNA polymerase sigma factor [Gemmataceae bacterium]
MADTYLATVLGQLAKSPGIDGVSDGQLLEQVVAGRGSEALEVLVRRHGPLVWRVCRRVLPRLHAAEDAFQATFLALAQQSATIRRPGSLAGWLHRVAYRNSCRLRADLKRLEPWKDDRASAVMPDPCTQAAWRELGRIIEEEVQHLPEKYRLPLLLCYWEGQTHEQAARTLAWPTGTVKTRLTKARKLLHAWLVRRGVTLAEGAIATLVGVRTAEAVPPLLLSRTAAAAKAGTLSARVAALARAAWPSALVARARAALILTLAAILVTAGFGRFAMRFDATAGASAKSVKVSSLEDAVTVLIQGTVVDGAGAPIANADVVLINFGLDRATQSKADGTFSATVPKQFVRGLYVLAKADNGDLQAFFANSYDTETAPAPIRLAVRKARAIPVTVIDGQGKPVAGASIAATVMTRRIRGENSDAGGHALLRVPADAPLENVYACKPGVGLNYVIYRRANEPASDPYKLAPDHTQPLRFALDGTREVRVRVVDNQQKPLPGVSVYPWYVERPRKGGHFNLSGIDEFRATTDEAGTATFRIIPTDNVGRVSFWAKTDNYFLPDQPSFDPKAQSNEVAIALEPLQLVRGKATFADGRPAAGAEVQVAGCGLQLRDFRGTAQCDRDGAFEIRVYSNQYCLFVAEKEHFASPAEMRIVRAGQVVDPVQLVLQPATRIHGMVGIGKDRSPLAGRRLTLYRRAEKDYFRLPKELQLPNPKDSHKGVNPLILRHAVTDQQGRFEFFAGPGRYYIIGPEGAPPPQFEITDQKDVEANLYTERPDRGVLAGRVVLKSAPGRSVSEAQVLGIATRVRGGRLRAVTDSDGRFGANRSRSPMVIQARTDDGVLSGIVRLGPDDPEVTIPVGPTASARGWLLDAASGAPLADRQVEFGVRVEMEGGGSMPIFGGSARTNASGEFVLTGLTTGWKFDLMLAIERDVNGSRMRGWRRVADITPAKADLIDLGEVKVTIPEGPPTLLQLIDRAFAAGEQPPARLQTKLHDARLAEQRVLLFAAAKSSEACQRFFALRYSRNRTEVERAAIHALANYTMLALDATEGPAGAPVRTLLERLKLQPPVAEGGTFAILGTDGRVVASTTALALMTGKQLDSKKLVGFLERYAQPVPDAEKLLADAMIQAKREDKRVLVQHSGAFCSPCVLLSRFLEKHQNLLAKDYVTVKLDTRFTNGAAVISRIRKEEGGIPWMVILDANGKSLITSGGVDGNIGFPSTAAGIAHFEKMLRATARHLTDVEIKSLTQSLSGPNS